MVVLWVLCCAVLCCAVLCWSVFPPTSPPRLWNRAHSAGAL